MLLHAYRSACRLNDDRLGLTGAIKSTNSNRDDRPCGIESARLAAASRRRFVPPRSMLMAFAARLVLATSLILQVSSKTTTAVEDHQQDHINDQLHPSLFVDTKYWIRNMEFGDRDNWRNRLRPCTLLERIAIDENGAIISLGDAVDNSFGSLESPNVRELVLATNGALLLEEDTLQSEQAYIKFLNQSGDCFDSSTLPDQLQDQHWFLFEASSDELSWFNAANWMSAFNEEIAELVPDSHQIPCGEDVVVFGSRRAASWDLIDANERSPVIPFKVNFRPSEQMTVEAQANKLGNPNQRTTAPMDTLRVSKLKIGDKSYTQDEFDQLVRLYPDNLFDFNDANSIFNSFTSNQSDDSRNNLDRPQRTLTIDESSIQETEQEQELCLDEAGCLCGNEQAKMMEIICSFNQPLELNEMPCLDPIRSIGYCNPICATSITIDMVPTKFSERYVSSLLNKLLSGEISDVTSPSQDYFSDHIFVGSRRTDHTKYEITLRLIPANNDIYKDIIGRDLELAQLIRQQFEKAAIKSFYGIKTINIKTSVLWRRNNRNTIFWFALIVTTILYMTLFVHYDNYLMDIKSQINLAGFNDKVHLFNSRVPSTNEVSYFNTDELALSTHQPDRDDEVQSDVEMDVHERSTPYQEYAMIELDARSITNSTHGLLKD